MSKEDTVLNLLQRILAVLENRPIPVVSISKSRVINDRFTDNGDGTILDKLQKVIWVKDPSQIPGFDKILDFTEAKEACKNLVYGGYNSGWRVPTITELCSIIDYTRHNPSWNTDIFGGEYSNFYWSATEYDASSAYLVNFANGVVGYRDKALTFYVRAVRSVQ